MQNHLPQLENEAGTDYNHPHKSLPPMSIFNTANGHPVEFFPSAQPSTFPLGPGPLGHGSPAIISSPLMSSPPHCSPLHVPPASVTYASHQPHFPLATTTGPNSFHTTQSSPHPLPANTSVSADPTSPMQVVYSPAHPLIRMSSGGTLYQQTSSASFTDNQLPNMSLHPAPSLPPPYLPHHPHPPQYSVTGIVAGREFGGQDLTGMHPPMVVGSEFPSHHLAALPRNDPPHQQYH